jgi:hypothetical protein
MIEQVPMLPASIGDCNSDLPHQWWAFAPEWSHAALSLPWRLGDLAAHFVSSARMIRQVPDCLFHQVGATVTNDENAG